MCGTTRCLSLCILSAIAMARERETEEVSVGSKTPKQEHSIALCFRIGFHFYLPSKFLALMPYTVIISLSPFLGQCSVLTCATAFNFNQLNGLCSYAIFILFKGRYCFMLRHPHNLTWTYIYKMFIFLLD